MSFLNKVFREILKIKPFFQSLGRFRLGVGVSFSADTPVTGSFIPGQELFVQYNSC